MVFAIRLRHHELIIQQLASGPHALLLLYAYFGKPF